jgi:hypothetical protein
MKQYVLVSFVCFCLCVLFSRSFVTSVFFSFSFFGGVFFFGRHGSQCKFNFTSLHIYKAQKEDLLAVVCE